MIWAVEFLPEAEDDFSRLDGSRQKLIAKAIEKVRKNPLPSTEGDYGKPLGNHSVSALAGLLKIKLKQQGLRIVYRFQHTDTRMLIIVIGVRTDGEVYKEAQRCIDRHK